MSTNDLEIFEGTILGKWHKVEAVLGEGSYGVVTRCLNMKNNEYEAIKVTKSQPHLVQQAKLEILVLKQLRCLDPDTCNLVKWHDYFYDNERVCLNFELLDQSLFDYIQSQNNQGIPITEMRPILYQLANALSHLKSMGIVHADLKPANVMVVDRYECPVQVKVIDFGLARPVSAIVPGACVQTLWYRAPEVILQFPFNESIDMWSLGLVAVELAIGQPLYPGYMDYDVLRFITETQGQPPDYVIDGGKGTKYYFAPENSTEQRWRFKTEFEFEYATGLRPKETRYIKLGSLDELEQLMKMRTGHHSDQHLLVSLIKQMLHLDADQRIKPLEVLRHPFFNSSFYEHSQGDVCIAMESTEDENLVVSQQQSCLETKTPQNVDCSIQNPDVYLTAEDKIMLYEALQRNTQLEKENEQQQQIQAETQGKLQELEKKNEDFQVRLNEALQRNTQLQEEKEQQQEIQTEIQGKLQELERENLELKLMHNAALQRNTDMQKEKEEQEETHRQTQNILQDFERKNTQLQVCFNQVKEKNTEMEEEKKHLEKICTEMQCTLEEMQKRNQELQEMYDESQQTNKDQHEATKAQEEKYEKLKEKYEEKQENLEELQKRCTTFEEQNEEMIQEMKNLEAEKHDLLELCMKKKKQRFRFFQKKVMTEEEELEKKVQKEKKEKAKQEKKNVKKKGFWSWIWRSGDKKAEKSSSGPPGQE